MNTEKLISKDDKIFIAGHNGMVGKSILNKFRDCKYQNLLTEKKADLDLTNYKDVKDWFIKNKPDVVINCSSKGRWNKSK